MLQQGQRPIYIHGHFRWIVCTKKSRTKVEIVMTPPSTDIAPRAQAIVLSIFDFQQASAAIARPTCSNNGDTQGVRQRLVAVNEAIVQFRSVLGAEK